MPYKPVVEEKNILIGEGDTIIVAGWTPVERVTKLLEKSRYAAIGSLYSAERGMNFLIRNLLANPQYNRIVVVNATKQDKIAGGCDYFMKWFHGDVDVTKYIDSCIPKGDIDKLKKNLAVVEIDSLGKLTGAIAILSWDYPKLSLPSKVYPMETKLTPTMPCSIFGHRVEGKTIAEAWLKIIQRIRTHGTVRPCSTGQWQELIDLVSVVTDEPKDFYFPEPNYLPCDRSTLIDYIPQVTDDAPYVEGVKYTYGQRIRSWFKRDQLQQVIDKLRVEPDAASGVISLWDVEDHEKGGSPCLNHLWFRIVNGRLTLTATFRSNDMFSAWVLNAMALRALQDKVAIELDLPMGELITISQSAHIYSYSWSYADQVCGERQLRTYDDPVGYFIVTREDDLSVLVEQIAPNGETVETYRGSNPLLIARSICEKNPTIQPDHAAYLGMEIQKAITDKNYKQK